MEPITTWSSEKVSDWLKGLDGMIPQYPYDDWHLTGQDLLQLSSRELDQLGVQKIGHQELILEAVEKLCSLTYAMCGESLRSLTEKVRKAAHSLQMGIQGRWRVNLYNGQNTTKLPISTLQAILNLITASKELCSLLNRYQHCGYTVSFDILSHCKELGTTVQKEVTVYEKEKDIISICRQQVAICDEILSSTPEGLLDLTAHLETVELVPVSPGDQLGIEITSTASSGHYISGTAAESPAQCCEKILAGDEVIQVNDQIVVGWSRLNLVKKLQEDPSGVTLVLKKAPVSLKHQESAPEPAAAEGDEDQHRNFLLERVTASVRSLSFRTAVQDVEEKRSMGQEESELAYDVEHLEQRSPELGDPDISSLKGSRGAGDVASADPGLPSPRELEQGRASVSSCPEMTDEKNTKKSSTKGTRTAMSRRRVSCRELGRPDCDGWLWKKKKDSGVFVPQKWQRFWFVLKGATLYWYTTQQEEKAEGLIKIPSYSIESAGEHKRKYVFKVRHQLFQTFFFAADNVSDMSKWINCLITAIQKYKKLHKNPPDSEEECYSETEPEDEGSHSPRSHRNRLYTKSQSNTLPLPKKKIREPVVRTGTSHTSTGGSKATEDEMGVLFHRLKEDGVSIIGNDQPQTHAHFRKSFIKRNKNPVINEKAHTLRALQSTLKAKEGELQMVNKVLEDTGLTSKKFSQWKEQNNDLFQEIEKLAAEKARRPRREKAEAVTGETGERLRELALSDGEDLVDAEPLSLEDSRSPTVESEADSSAPTSALAAVAKEDNYFFI